MSDVLERLRTEVQLAMNGGQPILAHSFELAIGEIVRLQAALAVARTGLLNIERRSEEARAELSKVAAANR